MDFKITRKITKILTEFFAAWYGLEKVLFPPLKFVFPQFSKVGTCHNPRKMLEQREKGESRESEWVFLGTSTGGHPPQSNSGSGVRSKEGRCTEPAQAGTDLMAQARNAYAGRTDPNFGSFPREALVPRREFLLTIRL